MKWFLKCLKQYADFNGRARRKEYWYYMLFYSLFIIATSIIDTIIFGTDMEGYGPLTIILSLGLFIPSIAVSVRRLHDIGKSGWMLLIILIPIVGAIWLLILAVKDSNSGENKYGINPKEITA